MLPQESLANRRERCGDHMPSCSEADVHQIARGALAHQASHIPPTHCSGKSKPRGWQPAACTNKQELEPARPQPRARQVTEMLLQNCSNRLSGQLHPTRTKAGATKTCLVLPKLTWEASAGSSMPVESPPPIANCKSHPRFA